MGIRRDARGATLVEVLLVVAILSVLAVAVVPSATDSFRRYRLDAATGDLVHALRQAQAKSMNALEGSAWSMRLEPGAGGSFTVFKGSDFGGRDPDFDDRFELPSGLSLSDTVADQDIVFRKVVGTTEDTGTVTVSWVAGAESRTVSINAAGRVEGP